MFDWKAVIETANAEAVTQRQLAIEAYDREVAEVARLQPLIVERAKAFLRTIPLATAPVQREAFVADVTADPWVFVEDSPATYIGVSVLPDRHPTEAKGSRLLVQVGHTKIVLDASSADLDLAGGAAFGAAVLRVMDHFEIGDTEEREMRAEAARRMDEWHRRQGRLHHIWARVTGANPMGSEAVKPQFDAIYHGQGTIHIRGPNGVVGFADAEAQNLVGPLQSTYITVVGLKDAIAGRTLTADAIDACLDVVERGLGIHCGRATP